MPRAHPRNRGLQPKKLLKKNRMDTMIFTSIPGMTGIQWKIERNKVNPNYWGRSHPISKVIRSFHTHRARFTHIIRKILIAAPCNSCWLASIDYG